jgi:hypothetical protein
MPFASINQRKNVSCQFLPICTKKSKKKFGIHRSPSEWPARASAQANLSDDLVDSGLYSVDFYSYVGELAICSNGRLGSSGRVGRRHHGASVPPAGREEIRSSCVVSHVGQFSRIWFNLIFNQSNVVDLKKSSPKYLEFPLVSYSIFPDFLKI